MCTIENSHPYLISTLFFLKQGRGYSINIDNIHIIKNKTRTIPHNLCLPLWSNLTSFTTKQYRLRSSVSQAAKTQPNVALDCSYLRRLAV
uniref:Uncharacterized protein n=1 Tax=Anguilla anguilla TaxID=7936 RepID=A0A0E9WD86_ANGAN